MAILCMSTVLSPILPAIESELVAHSERIPMDGNGPVFSAPWQAQAFALTLRLHEKGVFSWPEWSAALGSEIAAAGNDAPAEDYYRWWLAALERLVVEKAVATPELLARRQQAWRDAAAATPHGEPIRLAIRS